MEAWQIHTAIIILASVAIYAAGTWRSLRRTAYLMRGSILKNRAGRHIIVTRITDYCARGRSITGDTYVIPLRCIARDAAGCWRVFAWWEVK